MNKLHIIGSGACGFLRIHQMFKDNIPVKYKNGGPKYQNSFERWNENDGLIWEAESLSKEERLRRVSLHDTTTNITHSYLKYVPEFLELHPDMKFLCLRGRREHSIKSLVTSWGYRNPCYVKDRKIGFGHNRYAVSQFPNYSDSKDEFHATERYWDSYYKIANQLSEKYSNNFLIVDTSQFFFNTEYQLNVFRFLGINIDLDTGGVKAYECPVDFDKQTISCTLHGGLGNNLFQIAETLSFCKKHNLPEPIFGTWDLWQGGNKYPLAYNSDRFLGGHSGTTRDIIKTFPKINWSSNLIADYDTKFIVNDMFKFCDVENLDYVRQKLSITEKTVPGTVSLHLRFCNLPADDHVKPTIPDEFYFKVFDILPKKLNVLIFSDDNQRARQKLNWFRENFDMNFEIYAADSFQSLKKMVECEYHILNISTFSFWSAFLDINQPNSKVFYPQLFCESHSEHMIPYSEWQKI